MPDSPRLHAIDLDQPALEGFRKFISAWLWQGEETLLVDPGPLSTVPRLVEALRANGVERLDYILLTHIHIDHAGGTGAVLREFPEARVICHPEGVRHLVEPEKLWQGSRKVLGRLAEIYGEIVPIPAERIDFAEEIGKVGVRAYLTPGHAQHHCCYLLDDLLFGGEVAGVRGEVAEGIFMRPATPPKFLLDVALDSLDRMISLAPRRMVIAHYGVVEPALDYLKIARQQLGLWVRGAAILSELPEGEREGAMRGWLMVHDPIYRNVTQLPVDIQARERYFFGNTLRGMFEYVGGLADEERAALRVENSTMGQIYLDTPTVNV